MAEAPASSAESVQPMQEVCTVHKKTRMRLNGEVPWCMEHAYRVKERKEDTSVDAEWIMDESLKGRDRYVMVTSALWLLPKVLIFFPLLSLLVALPFLVISIYRRCAIPAYCKTPDRTTCSYRMFVAVVLVFALPLFVVAMVSLFLDYVMYYMFSIPFCLATCRFNGYCKSLNAIAPYTGGPFILFALSDVVTGFLGQESRQNTFEAICMAGQMFTVVPWMKYYINCNPWIYDLDERMVQQISTSMQDMTLPEICASGLSFISTTKQKDDLKQFVDKSIFGPHYPYPPPWKRWAIGIQAGGNQPPLSFFLFVHTTHALCAHGGSTEQFILSNSIAAPGYRVMLWYNNPYHFLTGWVEASITAGNPSQLDKLRGGEHPMWLVTSRSPLCCDRKSLTGSGFIDAFFDRWLPQLVWEFRKLTGKKADELREEVVSKDGISRPKQKKEVPFVDAGDVNVMYYRVRNGNVDHFNPLEEKKDATV